MAKVFPSCDFTYSCCCICGDKHICPQTSEDTKKLRKNNTPYITIYIRKHCGKAVCTNCFKSDNSNFRLLSKYIIRYEKVPKNDHEKISQRMVEYVKNGQHGRNFLKFTHTYPVSLLLQKENEILYLFDGHAETGKVNLIICPDGVDAGKYKISTNRDYKDNVYNTIYLEKMEIDGYNRYIDKLLSTECGSFKLDNIYINLQKEQKYYGYCNKCDYTSTSKTDDGIMECSCDDFATIFTKTRSVHTHNQTRQFLHFLEYMSILNIEYTLEKSSENNSNNNN